MKLALQLCQLPLDYGDALPRSDCVLLRVQVPLLLLEVLARKQARAAGAGAGAGAGADGDKDKTATAAAVATGKPAAGGGAKLNITLADLRALSGAVYAQSRDSISPHATGTLADLASPLPARTELIESVAKFVMQLLG